MALKSGILRESTQWHLLKKQKKMDEKKNKTVALLKAAPWPIQMFIQLMKWALKGTKGLSSEGLTSHLYFSIAIGSDKSDS